MFVKSMMFRGTCNGCGESSEQSRGAVEVALDTLDSCPMGDDDAMGEWICLSCASRLVKLLKRAIKKTNEKIEAGCDYRFDKWQKKDKTNDRWNEVSR